MQGFTVCECVGFDTDRLNARQLGIAGAGVLGGQIALPTDVCSTVYGSATGYSQSVNNLAQISFATDNVFSDGYTTELATVTGDVTNGYALTLTIGISV